jgi:hypothetical protein
MRFLYGVIGTVFLFFTLKYSAFAADIQVSLDPRNPEPGSSITLTAISYSFDINNAYVTWSSGGREILKGYGEKRLTIRTGAAGVGIPIVVKAQTDGGDYAQAEMMIVPQSVALLYETPESYVPRFYEGRSLPGENARVRFVAFGNIADNGRLVAPENLSYNWYINGEFQDSVSGRGKQVATLPLDLLSNETEVKVIARSSLGGAAEKTITVVPHPVMPMLYYYDDLFGVDYTRPIVNRLETTKAFTLAFEPFYLSQNGPLVDYITTEWTLGGLPVTPSGGRKMLFDPKKESFGSNTLSISVTNAKRRLQKALVSIDILFDTR